jgi:eukaryotic-like serine/threonine-protein kinase
MAASGDIVAGRYRLVSQIGTGGMGRVWHANDEFLHRDVALKEVVFPPDLTGPERDELIQRTLREGRAAGRLSHPNVVAVYDVISAEGRPWIVMELVRSRSLYQVIRAEGPLSPRRTAELGLSVLAALRAAHKAGVWHRDVKPSNVLLAEDGRVVLTDFGLATYDGDGNVTRDGLIMGSAQFISPERARDGVSGPESDMWSLGATLFTAVEGRSPYARQSATATLAALATDPPDTPRRAGPLRPVLLGLLRRNPRHRMRAPEAEKLLRRVADGEGGRGSGARRSGLLSRRSENDAGQGTRGNSADLAVGGAVAVATAGSAGTPLAPAGSVGTAAEVARAGPKVTTAAEDTYRHQPVRRRRWRWVMASLALAVSVPTSLVLWYANRTPPASPPPDAAAPAVLSAAMGVQACAVPAADRESDVPDGGPIRPGEFGLLAGWTYFRDPSGFRLAVPQAWRMSRIGDLLCFRDPSSPRAIGVLDHGRVAGEPLHLLADGERAWRDEARLTDYRRLSLTDAHYDEGAADLEYTYRSGESVLHGMSRMVRLDGRLFTLYWLTTDFTWSADRALLDFLQPSFELT